MPRATWAFQSNRPIVEVEIADIDDGGVTGKRRLLVDTGAGSDKSAFELLLSETDCRTCGTYVFQDVKLGGAFSGSYPVYAIRVLIPALGFDDFVRAVAVPTTPPHMDGIAAFRFLNRFTYGNFGRMVQFGLET